MLPVANRRKQLVLEKGVRTSKVIIGKKWFLVLETNLPLFSLAPRGLWRKSGKYLVSLKEVKFSKGRISSPKFLLITLLVKNDLL